jgi:hypothetical protein
MEPSTLLPLLAATALSLSPQQVVDSGTIRIHLLGHAIGAERYVLQSASGALALTDTFAFADRGGKIQLAPPMRALPRSSTVTVVFGFAGAVVIVAGLPCVCQ